MVKLTCMAKEIEDVLDEISMEHEKKAVQLIREAKRIFVSGAGRSGLICRMFAMRLMHLGIEAYVVGDVETPAAGEGDLLIVASGSGSTTLQIAIVEKARRLGTTVMLFTYEKDGILASKCNHGVLIPAPRYGVKGKGYETRQPMGNLFEQCLLLCLDHLIILLMSEMGASSEKMMERHANLE